MKPATVARLQAFAAFVYVLVTLGGIGSLIARGHMFAAWLFGAFACAVPFMVKGAPTDGNDQQKK